MRHGITLPELLVAMVLLGVLVAIGVPAATAARDRALLVLHARSLAAAHADTRGAALRTGARVELVVTPARYEQRTTSGTIVWRRPGPASDGIQLVGPATPIVFDSRGYTLGAANRTYRLTRGREGVQVVMSRLGRLRVVR